LNDLDYSGIMRKLIFAINVSIDGCCDHTKFMPGDDVHDYFTRLTQEADILLYGRKTYELMVPFWPDLAKNPGDNPEPFKRFAQAFVAVPQIVVFSNTLKQSNEKNTTFLRGDLRKEILKLKEEDGKSILVGGVQFPSELVALDLVDEIRLVVHPYVVGEGRRLFNELKLQQNLTLKLVESHTFDSGSVAHRYLKHS